MIKIDDEKVILLGDVHIGARQDAQWYATRLEQFLDQMFDYMDEKKITTIVQFGDLFDRRKFINYITLKNARRYFFDKLVSRGYKMYTLIGNHDIPLKNTLEGHSPSLLLDDYSEYITAIDKPTEIEIHGTKVLVVPWICSDNQTECLEMIENTSAKLCFGHFELAGFEMYKGAICEHGLPKENFHKFHHVYSGHFHHVSTNGNITYIGSPCQITWADYGDDRGFFVLDGKTLKTEFIKNKFDNFYKINYDDADDKFLEKDLEKINFSVYNNTYVKVIIKTKNNAMLFEEFMKRLDLAGAIASTMEEHKYEKVDLDGEEVSAVDSVEDTLKRMASQFKETVDADKLATYLISLHNQALNSQSV